jgi:ubiquitin carboxyl-terminal hydrolase 22/27/51
MAGSRPATPASPKVHRPRAQEPGVPLFGCGKHAPRISYNSTSKAHAEHLRLLITKSPDSASQTIRSYKKLLQVIFDNTPIISQTSKSPDGLPITSLTPNYLCLQCSATCTAKDRPKHGALTKHRLCMLLVRSSVRSC